MLNAASLDSRRMLASSQEFQGSTKTVQAKGNQRVKVLKPHMQQSSLNRGKTMPSTTALTFDKP